MTQLEEGGLSPETHIDPLEINKKSSCHGEYITYSTEGGERHFANFVYGSVSVKASELMSIESSVTNNQEIKEKFENLGLQDIGFSIYTRRNERMRHEGDEVLQRPANYYVLLHGWTADRRIYSDVKTEGELSVVEQIMANDPDAVIITVDGNGFGETKFRPDILENSKLLDEHCTPEMYAEQVDFLIRELLWLDPKKTLVAGHSMGGAATIELSTMGYGSCIALAPAAFADRELLKILDANKDKLASLLDDPAMPNSTGVNLSTATYGILGTSVDLGEFAAGRGTTMSAMSGKVVGAVFEKIGPLLMGHRITGDVPKDEQIVVQLQKIHGEEITPETFSVVSADILALGRGMNFGNFSQSDNLKVYYGTQDVLVRPRDLRVTALAMYAAQKSAGKAPAYKFLQQVTSQEHSVEGGHYSVVYDPHLAYRLVNSHPNKKEKQEV